MNKRFRGRLLVLFLLMLMGSGVASAQSSACVHLLVGAGYAAEMRIVYGNLHTDWSSSFAIGSTKCQSLDAVPDGSTFTVEVHALAGETKKCTPENVTRSAASKSSVTFQAWGPTLGVKCQEPGSTENAEMTQAAKTPNPEGAKAASSATSGKST